MIILIGIIGYFIGWIGAYLLDVGDLLSLDEDAISGTAIVMCILFMLGYVFNDLIL